MLCFNIKRHLYDLHEGRIDRDRKDDILAHLKKCPSCASEYRKIQDILNAASDVTTPKQDNTFWADFDKGLEEKLEDTTFFPQEIKFKPTENTWSLKKPALAFVIMVTLIFTVSLYMISGFPSKDRVIMLSDEAILAEIEMLEEVIGEPFILESEDFIFDDMVLTEGLS